MIPKRSSTAPKKYKIKEKIGNLLHVQIVIVVLVNVVQYDTIYHVDAAVFVTIVPAPALIHSLLQYCVSSTIRTSPPILFKTYFPNRNFGQSSSLIGSIYFSIYHSPTRLRNQNTRFSEHTKVIMSKDNLMIF